MKFRIEEKVFDLYPELHIGVMTFKDIDNMVLWDDGLISETCKLVHEVHSNIEGLHPKVQAYKDAMKFFKKKKGMYFLQSILLSIFTMLRL